MSAHWRWAAAIRQAEAAACGDGKEHMQLLTSGLDLDAFFEHVRCAENRVLLLDYDGTLAPFTVDRAKAVPYPSVMRVLAALLLLPRLRVAIVSGRAVADLADLIGVRPLPELWGSHGWEHRSVEGTYSLAPVDEACLGVLRRAGEILDAMGVPNLRESKPMSVAAHWRGLPPDEAERVGQRVRHEWAGLVRGVALELHVFDGGLELRAEGRNKGSVVAEVLAGSARDAAVAYCGDDLTDEDAFRALAGKGLRVLVRPTLRETLADIWLLPPVELVDFLERWERACTV